MIRKVDMKLLKHIVFTGLVLLSQGISAAEVCLFDEETDFAGKLFRSFDNGTADVVTGSAFNGQRSLAVTPGGRGCESFYDRAFIWEYGIAEKPVAGEFRYVLFAWKKTGGKTIQIGFRDDRSDLVLTYYAGEEQQFRVRKNMKYVQVADIVPETWTVVIRDLYADMEGCQPNMLINGIYFVAGDGKNGSYDSIYLGDSLEKLEQLAAKLKEGSR
jgi:hypothetical protein